MIYTYFLWLGALVIGLTETINSPFLYTTVFLGKIYPGVKQLFFI